MIFLSTIDDNMDVGEALLFFDLWDDVGNNLVVSHPTVNLSLSKLFSDETILNSLSLKEYESDGKVKINFVDGSSVVIDDLVGSGQSLNAMYGVSDNLINTAKYLISQGVSRDQFENEFSDDEISLIVEAIGLRIDWRKNRDSKSVRVYKVLSRQQRAIVSLLPS